MIFRDMSPTPSFCAFFFAQAGIQAPDQVAGAPLKPARRLIFCA
jgi:hypothetical protein